MSIEAMKLALEALDDLIVYSWDGGKVGEPDKTEDYAGIKAMEALRTAIEQAEKQEPVAWTLLLVGNHHGIVGKAGEIFANHPEHYRRVNVYIAPPKREWQGLTEDEIDSLGYFESRTAFVRAIESALEEKNI